MINLEEYKVNVLTVNSQLDYLHFKEFIDTVEKDFYPNFLSYVNLSDYYNKIVEKGQITICRFGEEIAGILCFYCNDEKDKKAYVSFLAVNPLYRNRGIARSLMEKTILYCLNKSMKCIQLRTNNEIALRLYLSFGYILTEKIFEEEIGRIRYYLRKEL